MAEYYNKPPKIVDENRRLGRSSAGGRTMDKINRYPVLPWNFFEPMVFYNAFISYTRYVNHITHIMSNNKVETFRFTGTRSVLSTVRIHFENHLALLCEIIIFFENLNVMFTEMLKNPRDIISKLPCLTERQNVYFSIVRRNRFSLFFFFFFFFFFHLNECIFAPNTYKYV